MAGAAIRVIFTYPQHGWNDESTSIKILGGTPTMRGSYQHGAEKKKCSWQSSWLGWLNDNTLRIKITSGWPNLFGLKD